MDEEEGGDVWKVGRRRQGDGRPGVSVERRDGERDRRNVGNVELVGKVEHLARGGNRTCERMGRERNPWQGDQSAVDRPSGRGNR